MLTPDILVIWRARNGKAQSSEDGGKTWSNRSIADGVSFQAVLAQGRRVWAGGSRGMLYLSEDQGATWKQQWSYGEAIQPGAAPNPADVEIYKIDFMDDTRGNIWIRSKDRKYDLLMYTWDGGKTWIEETID